MAQNRNAALVERLAERAARADYVNGGTWWSSADDESRQVYRNIVIAVLDELGEAVFEEFINGRNWHEADYECPGCTLDAVFDWIAGR